MLNLVGRSEGSDLRHVLIVAKMSKSTPEARVASGGFRASTRPTFLDWTIHYANSKTFLS